jgi:hypothetical protein
MRDEAQSSPRRFFPHRQDAIVVSRIANNNADAIFPEIADFRLLILDC